MWRHIYVVSAYIATLPYNYYLALSRLAIPVKITVQVPAAGCQFFYRKFYGFFIVYGRKVSLRMTGLLPLKVYIVKTLVDFRVKGLATCCRALYRKKVRDSTVSFNMETDCIRKK